jgi:tRNA-dihydrouridine synthase A
MQAHVSMPVTVKCRIGVDEQDSYAALYHFIQTIANTGCDTFIIHARKAWLQGLSPKQNREIPPLHYDVVMQIKRDFPHLRIMVNGGIKTLAQLDELLPHVDGAMIGREAYHNPYFLAQIEHHFFGAPLPERRAIINQFLPYIENQLANGVRLNSITRHILGLFQGQRGAGAWRRYLSQHAHLKGAGIEVIQAALQLISEN